MYRLFQMSQPILQHDYQRDEPERVQNLPGNERERPVDRVRIKPFSIWMLAVWGLAFFLAGFFSARPGTDFTATNGNLGNSPSSQSAPPAVQTSAAPANPIETTVAEPHAPAVAHVMMNNMKFSPATIEIKHGESVEWTNEDITPHTATALPYFDSGSLASGKSWVHTFTAAGSFPYGCTFHPDMKGVVIVR